MILVKSETIQVGHNSHYHNFYFYTSSNSHAHDDYGSGSTNCTEGTEYHDHLLSVGSGGSHYHYVNYFTSTESASDLNHTHTFSSNTDSASDEHSHAGSCYAINCEIFGCTPHGHSMGSTNTSGGSHSHYYSGTTSIGYNGDVYNHNHYISTSSDIQQTHGHTSPSITNIACSKGRYHGHTTGSVPTSLGHAHTLASYTGYGGEPPPAAKKKTFSSPVM